MADAVTPSGADPSTPAPRDTPSGPLRTCLGCRRRESRSSLLRLVAVTGPSSQTVLVRPDPSCRLPGRGAWIHPTSACLESAARRRAFGRALRVQHAVDLDEVRAVVQTWQVEQQDGQGRRQRADDAEKRTESGFDADESPMSTQQ